MLHQSSQKCTYLNIFFTFCDSVGQTACFKTNQAEMLMFLNLGRKSSALIRRALIIGLQKRKPEAEFMNVHFH